MKALGLISALVVAAAVGACGTTTQERALSGAGIGAAAGGTAGAVTGGDVLGGALLGGVAGGAAGALTKEEDINLGEPIWKR